MQKEGVQDRPRSFYVNSLVIEEYPGYFVVMKNAPESILNLLLLYPVEHFRVWQGGLF
jgi:hypothetical protein